MTKQDLKSMSVDELWSLHERVTLALARKIADEKWITVCGNWA